VAGCDVGISTRPKEAANAFSEYCPSELQETLQAQIPSNSYIGVEDCDCAGIPACSQCVFSPNASYADGGPEQAAAAQQQDVEEMGMKWVSLFASRSPEIADLLKEVRFRSPDETFEKEKLLDLGGVRVRIIRMGPGHTRGDTVTFVEGDRVLFSGDLAMKGLFPAFATPQSRSESWLASLDEMERLKPRIVVGAHYDVTDATVISDYRAYLTALRARVGELKKEGKPAEEAAEIVRAEMAKKYPDWQQPIRANAAAMVVYRELP
jgi:glyoxylase-like metal-dependent hydrolase (beta-lactamase superfamily II)